MISRRFLLTGILFLFVANAGAALPDAQLVYDFVTFLVRDDVNGVAPLTLEGTDTSNAWMDATIFINRYRCIEVRTTTFDVLHATEGERLLRVTIHGTGVTVGGPQIVETLPNEWVLKAVLTSRGWRLAEVATAETRLAKAMVAAACDSDRRTMLDEHLDLGRLSAVLAFVSVDGDLGERGFTIIQLAREIAAAQGDLHRESYAVQMESTLHSVLNRPARALEAALLALEIALASGDPDAIGKAHFAVGIAHWSANDIVSAIASMRRSAAMADSVLHPPVALMSLVMVAHFESSRRNLIDSLAAAGELERLARKYDWPQGQVDAFALQASLHDRLGNYAAAEQLSLKSLALAVRIQRQHQIDTALRGLGNAALRRGDADEAIARFGEASNGGPSLDLAIALEKKGRLREAVEMYERFAPVGEAGGEAGAAAAARIRMSRLSLAMAQPERALELARAARAVLPRQRVGGSTGKVAPWETYTAEGMALRALGRNTEATEAFQTAIAGVEAERGSFAFAEATHTDFFGERIEPYRELIELMVQAGRNADAVRLSEHVKASVLDEVVNAGRTGLAARLTDEEHATQQRLEAELVRLNREILEGTRDGQVAEALRSELAAARARWEQNESLLYARAGIKRAPKITDPLQSPAVLIPTAGDVILNFMVSEKQTTLFVLSRDGEEVRIETHVIAVGTARLKRDVERFLGRLASLNFDYEDDARSLYRLLIAPAENALRGKSAVAIVADGPLWKLPFQVLADRDGRPLVARFAMFYAPSLTSLTRAASASDADRPSAVLAIGNPRVGTDTAATVRAQMRATLGDLPDAAVEAREVAALYDRSRSRVLTGTEATEQAMKERAAEYDILHLAAHAVTDDSQPLYSSIVLARQDDREDGLLEGREITQLALRARLTVLSACSTAQGRVRPGEGLIGLSWAFLVAGCPTIVATQWRVPSVSTSKLMIDFHRQLARGDISVAEALRRAQMRLMKDRRYRHPFYWSGFVVVGAGGS